MTARPKPGAAATAQTPAADTSGADTAMAATSRQAKGSVQEAIGKLIGDDAARARGTAEKEAGAAAAASDTQKSPRR